MTIAISIKTSEGVILASDSATTISNNFNQVITVYNNENKLANLHYDLPIGANTWGLGHINAVSISSHFKDFRSVLMDDDEGIDTDAYTMKAVVDHFKKFIYDDRYLKCYKDSKEKPGLGFF